MVRHYVPKRPPRTWTDEDLRAALKSSKRMSIRAAAIKHGIPKQTFHRYCRTNTLTKKANGNLPIFAGPAEEQLIRYIDKLNDVFFGISPRDLRRLAYDLAERLHLKHTFKPHAAGEDWSFKFQARHPDVKIRSLKGPKVVDERLVPKFFRRLSRLIKLHGIDTNDIYNVDEIGVVYFVASSEGNGVRTERPRLDPMLTGRLQLDVIFKTDGVGVGQLVTAICCFNAAGSFLPPTFVFPCEQLDVGGRLSNVDVAPPGSLALFSDDGWTNREVFVDWLSFFVKHVRPSKDRKVLLLMDNDESHVSMNAFDYAREHGVVLLSVPTHSAERLLPLQHGLFAPLSTRFDQVALDHFDSSASSKELELVSVFGRAFLECSNMRSAVDAFKQSGISPRDVDQDVHPDDDFDDHELSDYFDAIDSEDEVHLIHALYRNGNAADDNHAPVAAKSNKPNAKAKQKPKPKPKAKLKPNPKLKPKAKHKTAKATIPSSPPTATSTNMSKRRSRKSLPRKCRESALRIENFVDDSSI